MRRSTRRFTVARSSSSISSPFSSRTVCSSSFMYISKPTASICPLCSPPSRLPAPRISRSSAATRKPLPRSLNSLIAASRFFATGDRFSSGGITRYAYAQLIELRQAVPIGAVDDDRVRIRDVEAVLDDRRRQQHVELARDEVEHRALERVLVHLAVADDDACFGNETLNQAADREDRLDAVVDEEHLPAARDLVADRAPDHFLVELHDVGLDRQAILRGRLDDRHVADADERHVQRPRNRRRAHRQHVDLLPELLDLLL